MKTSVIVSSPDLIVIVPVLSCPVSFVVAVYPKSTPFDVPPLVLVSWSQSESDEAVQSASVNIFA